MTWWDHWNIKVSKYKVCHRTADCSFTFHICRKFEEPNIFYHNKITLSTCFVNSTLCYYWLKIWKYVNHWMKYTKIKWNLLQRTGPFHWLTMYVILYYCTHFMSFFVQRFFSVSSKNFILKRHFNVNIPFSDASKIFVTCYSIQLYHSKANCSRHYI